MSSAFVAQPDVCSPSASKADRAISGLAIFLGAFLLFQIQPMIAKMILPWFGGSQWYGRRACYFFNVLLLGYAYARWLSAKRALALAPVHWCRSDTHGGRSGPYRSLEYVAFATLLVWLAYQCGLALLSTD